MKTRDGLSTVGSQSMLDAMRSVATLSAPTSCEVALALAEYGVEVFPCEQESAYGIQQPMVAEWRDSATKDPNKIILWWDQWPDATVGVRMPTGVIALDIDPASDGSYALAEQLLTVLPQSVSLWVSGGRGRRHVLCSAPTAEIRPDLVSSGPIHVLDRDSGYMVVPVDSGLVFPGAVAVQVHEAISELPELPSVIEQVVTARTPDRRGFGDLDGIEITMFNSHLSDEYFDSMLRDFEDSSTHQIQWIYSIAAAIVAHDDGTSPVALVRILTLAHHAQSLGFSEKDLWAAIRMAAR